MRKIMSVPHQRVGMDLQTLVVAGSAARNLYPDHCSVQEFKRLAKVASSSLMYQVRITPSTVRAVFVSTACVLPTV